MSNDQQNAFATDVDVIFGNGGEIDDAQVISFVIERDFDQADMAVITLRNDGHHNTKARSPGETAEIKVGAPGGGAKTTIFKGKVYGFELNAKAGGESRLLVRCYNDMRKMLYGRKSKTFQSMSDQDVVGQLVGPHSLNADTGSTPKITHDHIYQHNQTDLEFIRVRAARLGYRVWCEDNKLFFKKPDTTSDSGIKLNIEQPGEHHLKAFHARLSAADVHSKVTVRGWDPKKKAEIVGEASPEGTRLGKTQAHTAAGDLGSAATFTVDHPIYSVEEAQAIAKAKLDEYLMRYILAEAECRGHSGYKPGIVIEITVNNDDATKSEDRFNGKYLVCGVTHKYTHGTGGNQSGGFVSVLRLARDAEKPS